MANFNKIIMAGNLTRDPQLSYLPSNTAIVDFSLATTKKYYGQDKQLKDEVCFIDCRAFGKPAENINKFCKKGNPLLVEGRLIFDSWVGKDGSKHSKHRVTVENFQLLGTANKGKADNSAGSLPQETAPSSDGGLSEDLPF